MCQRFPPHGLMSHIPQTNHLTARISYLIVNRRLEMPGKKSGHCGKVQGYCPVGRLSRLKSPVELRNPSKIKMQAEKAAMSPTNPYLLLNIQRQITATAQKT